MADADLTYEELRSRLYSAEEALRRSERLAIVGRYACAVMHEVNNPLEAIGNLLFLTKKQAEDPVHVRDNIQVAEAQLERLGEIARKTLSYYRADTGPKEFDLVEIAEAAFRIHRQSLFTDSVTIVKQFPTRLMFQGMAGEILQVLSNFILNSLQALPDQNGVIRMRLRTIGSSAQIVIADNGSGIPASLQKNLFDPYATSKREGTGLGLWLSQQIINKHYGKIRFRSSQRPGRSGTIFRLVLPLNRELGNPQLGRSA